MISGSKVDKIGNLLKHQQAINPADYRDLLDWRNSFSSILDYYHSKLRDKLDQNDVVTLSRRLKRIESIQIKLKRYPTMRLSTLQDIAGLRVVVKDEQALQAAFSRLRSLASRHTLKRVDNYHSQPKADGYRGFHLIYQVGKEGKQVEIQLRTELEHIWATAVEIYGELQETSFKTGGGDKDWKVFFRLLSSYFAIKENSLPAEQDEKKSQKKIQTQLKKMMKELNVIEKLNASTNGMQVITRKHNRIGRTGRYAILEMDLLSKTTEVEFFNKKDVEKAIATYTKKELEIRDSEKKNIVFVNVDNIDKIEASYPNYFLNTKKLLEILAKIVLGQEDWLPQGR